jgi:hypothetical protein
LDRVEGWEISIGGRGIIGPSDRIEEIERHVENGCWIYSATGWIRQESLVFATIARTTANARAAAQQERRSVSTIA